MGLNLQHASVVLNMDLPWNPAVLEQRIGRVHRLGQTRPVRVVHFIAQGTIEEGMLARLGFKRSLFAGVLDGGEREVFLGGSRLARFMESVEQATARPGGENAGAVDAPDGCHAGDPLSAAPLVDALGGLFDRGRRPRAMQIEGGRFHNPRSERDYPRRPLTPSLRAAPGLGGAQDRGRRAQTACALALRLRSSRR